MGIHAAQNNWTNTLVTHRLELHEALWLAEDDTHPYFPHDEIQSQMKFTRHRTIENVLK